VFGNESAAFARVLRFGLEMILSCISGLAFMAANSAQASAATSLIDPTL
jgi:hypothetical protein